MTRLERICRELRLPLNDKRRVILEVLESTDHPSAIDIYRCAAALHRDICMSTIYRNLRLLEKAGVIVRLEISGGPTRYEEAGRLRHEHLVDLRSGAVLEFFEPGIQRLIYEVTRRLGYRLVDYRLDLFAEPTESVEKEHDVSQNNLNVTT